MIYGADHVSLQTARGGPVAGGDIGTNMLPPSVPGAEGQKYDPYEISGANKGGNEAKAKEALKACGQPNGFKTTIAVRNNKPVEVATAQSLQASLKKVGITAEIDQYDGSQTAGIIGSPSNVKKKGYGIIIMGWGPDFPSVQGFGLPLWSSKYIAESGNNNYALIKDKAIDGLFDSYVTTLDDAGKTKISTEINHKVMEGAYYLLRLRAVHQLALGQPGERLHDRRLQRSVRLRQPRSEEPEEVNPGTPAERHERQVKAGAA